MPHRENQKGNPIEEFENLILNNPKEIDEKKIVESAEAIAKTAKNVTYNQIRQVHGIINNALKKENLAEKKKILILAKPKIAYRKRNLSPRIVDLYLKFIDQVYNDRIEEKYLQEFTEALIAYMKYYEKK